MRKNLKIFANSEREREKVGGRREGDEEEHREGKEREGEGGEEMYPSLSCICESSGAERDFAN